MSVDNLLRKVMAAKSDGFWHAPALVFGFFLFVAFGAPQAAVAQSWNLGLTAYGQADHGPQAEMLFERQFRPFAELGKWSIAPGVGLRVTSDTGSWVGGGIIAYRSYGQNWRVDAGIMPGYYTDGSEGAVLGSDLEFRSYLSLGREVTDGLFVALGIEHMSNGGLGNMNPGDNRLLLRFIKLDRR